MKQRFMTTKEAAKSLGLRLGTLYGLIWDEVIAAKKDENGAWLVDHESLERYRLRRNLRRQAPRSALQRRAIDVAPEPTPPATIPRARQKSRAVEDERIPAR